MPRGSQSRRVLERMFSGQALHTNIDETGRLVLPQRIRDKVGIVSDAIFVASGDTFQIWLPDSYSDHEAEIDLWYNDQEVDFDPLILLENESVE